MGLKNVYGTEISTQSAQYGTCYEMLLPDSA